MAVLRGLYAAMLLFVLGTPAQAQSVLTRHVRQAVIGGRAGLLNLLPATQSLRIDIVLPLRNEAGLDEFLREVYDPRSPSYRHFLTVSEFTARFGPSQEDYDAVLQYATSNGLTVVGGSRDGMDVQIEASVSDIEKAFNVHMGTYQHPTENRTFYAPDREPTLSLPFPVWHISGLDNYSIPRPALLNKGPGVTAQPNTTTGSCPSGSYCGSDLRAAYYGGTALTGSGQTVGLLEFFGYDTADVNTYFRNVKQKNNVPIVGVSTDGTSLTCLSSKGCDDTEQTIDITQAVSMAPGLTALYVYVGSTDTAILSAMSTHSPLSSQLSSSWTWSPADPSTDDPYFKKFAAQGQNVFQAAGDSGAYTFSSEAVYPADDAYVTVVGGTDLQTSGPGGTWVSETVWVDGGGGYFTPGAIPIPSWQQLAGVITSSNGGSTTLRNSPDVAAEANFDFYVCANQTTCTAGQLGGTSFAAPMWAGYLALANQQLVASGKSTLGFINPTIYEFGLGSGYATDFHDITGGSNGYPAEIRYDLATGWGSPNGAGLINALIGAPTSASFNIFAAPTSVSVVLGSNGTSTITTAVFNGFDSAIDLSATGQPAGATVTFSPPSIAAPGSGTSTMTMSVASTTTPGTYTIVVTGASGSLQDSASVTLVVPPIAVSVTPSGATLYGGQAQQFLATVSNTSNTAVTWALSPSPGTLSPAGLYTAPATINMYQVVTVTATSVADATKSASATITLVPPTSWYNPSWTGRKALSIDHTKVSGSSNLTNFPVLISVTDANLMSVANGGNVGKNDGTDILFTAADGITKFNHELESYSPTTGQVIAWVQVPSLSPATNTVLYMYYGNASAADQQNKTGVWDSTYKGVWHLPNGTTLSVTDSTSNALSATNQGGTATGGDIGGGASFSGSSSSYLSVASSPALDPTAGTWSGWVKTNQSVFGVYPLLWARANGSGSASGITLFLEANTGHARVQVYGSALALDITGGSAALNDGNWHYLALTFNAASTATLYVDGAAIASDTPKQNWSFNGQVLRFAAALDSYWTPLNGSEDEFRVSNVVRSSGWIATEYNSQNLPATFLSFGSAQSAPVAVSVTPPAATLYGGQTQQFTATVSNTSNTAVTWALSPNTGTISAAGQYIAPATITTQLTVTVTAASVADATKSATATITLVPQASWYNGSWTSRKAFTIDHTKVSGSSNLTNFPVLISVTDASLRSLGNGGNVGKNDGTDILFTASDGSTKLNHELETYSPTTGQLIAWVQMPSLSAADNTVLYMYSGNAAAADQQNRTGVWDSTYKGVFHVANGTTLSVADSTSNTLSATSSGATATGGEIGGGASFSGSSGSYLSVTSSPALDSTTGTWSGWFKTSQSVSGVYPLLWARANGTSSLSGITLFLEASTGHARMQLYGSTAPVALDISGGSTALNDGNWHYLVLTFNASSTATLYVDGSAVAAGTPSQGWSFNGQALRFAAALDSFWTPLNGSEDEFRVSNVVRTADWVATEYNNQSLPATFLNFGSVQGAPVTVSVTPSAATLYGGQTQQFTATVSNTSNTAVTWTLSPNPGTISAAGLYTAPATISTQQTVTVTATSVADTTKSATATITLSPPGAWYNTSWANRRAVTIGHSNVSGSSDLTNFPVLISVTDASLKSAATGGGVGKTDGTDILFTASDGVTKLNHELELYNAATGQLIAWVQVPSLSPVTNTALYMYYGNAGAGDQQNKTGVWDSSYKGVWHLGDGTALAVADSTSNALSAANSAAAAAAGKIDGAASFSGLSSSYLSVASSPALDSTTGTWAGWFRTSQSVSGVYPLLWARANGTSSHSGITLFLEASTGHARVQVYGTGAPAALDITGGSAALNDGNWHYLVLTFNASSTATLYVDGSAVASGTPSQSWSFNGQALRFAVALDSFWTPLNGAEDEFRVSSVVRSANWILTEYNNESSPSAFFNLGNAENSPITVTPSTATLSAGQTQQFTATVSNTSNTAVTWALNPNTGTISAAGLYAAPATIGAQQTVIVTATSVADTTKSATATITLSPVPWYNTSWTNRKAFTVDHTKISGSSNLTNFPVLISVTDASLKSLGNGGNVGKNDGTDILFTASDGVTKLNHELETYSAVTGKLIAWVQAPSLSPTTDTVFYVYYGNTSAADQQNKTGVWDSSYAGVWHVPDGANLSVADSTSNALSTANNGAAATGGKTGGGASFSGSGSSYLSVASSPALDSTTGTWSGWFKTSQSVSGVYPVLWSRANAAGSLSGITLFLEAGTGHARLQLYGSAAPAALDITGGSAALNDGNWHYLALTFNAASTATLYVDGSAVASGTPSRSWSFNGQALRFAVSLDSFWAPLNGAEDEFRVSSAVRSPGWVATEYNNQSAPAAFVIWPM
ncbi:MAG: DUF2341 domain-containing protein [Acidobacteriia bacterium]|nr:DUF2341 domain-containing protein [Terriglobia bacterium]